MTTTLTAPAKINLALDVVGKKDNGYHLVEMIMQTISLHDEVSVAPDRQTSVVCNRQDVPTDETNICIKAWKLMQETYSLPDGIKITIKKNIPVAAGMAGGSTNGAAVIAAVNREFGLNLALPEMKSLGGRLGADVPFCLQKGTALATGIGDVLQELSPCPKIYVLAVNPGFEVSTVQVYKNLAWHKITEHPDTAAMIKAIKKQDSNGVLRQTGNVLENSAFQLFPQLAAIKSQIGETGLTPLMSGSGGTMLGLTEDREKAAYALNKLQGLYPFAGIFETI